MVADMQYNINKIQCCSCNVITKELYSLDNDTGPSMHIYVLHKFRQHYCLCGVTTGIALGLTILNLDYVCFLLFPNLPTWYECSSSTCSYITNWGVTSGSIRFLTIVI